jgi:hypothetical protein
VSTKVTRRDLAAALLAATPLTAQAQEAAKAAPEDQLRVRMEELNANSKKLGAMAVPMATEPAFLFKA